MRIERTKNATRNIIFGVILKAYQILVPFLMRIAMIYLMGVQYLGLNSLFTSILQVLNLAELGVGSAMIYSMYKPIAEDDNVTICALMKLYRTYYRVIGLIIAVIGCVLTPFIPKLISGDVPEQINIYTLYLLNLGATVLSYWLYAYKNSIIQAHQRTDVVSKVNLVTSTIQYVLQLFVLWAFKNYYLYVVVMLVTQAVINVAIAIVADKLYPQFRPNGKLPKQEVSEINHRIGDLFTSKIGTIIVNSADTIVISAFLGLAALAIYQNYYFILTSITGFVTVIFSAVTAGIGNSLVVETKEKNFKDLNVFTFIICWIAGFCSCCFLNLYQPFMEIWVGKNLMLDYSIVICFVVCFYVCQVNQLLCTYKDAGGIWHEDRFRPLVTALVNLGMNLVMVQFWGLYGIILSTVLSMLFVGMPWLFHNLFTKMFEKKYMKQYLASIAFYALVSIVAGAVSVVVCSFVNYNLWLTLLIRLVICLIVPNAIYLAAYYRKPEFKKSVLLVDKMTKGKIAIFNRVEKTM